jgi:hypothetical protein
MGVPGDMNLELLDYIDGVEGLSWGKATYYTDLKYVCTAIYILTLTVGNANELNAAYAADGYSRVKRCPGVCGLPSLSHYLSPRLFHLLNTPTEVNTHGGIMQW